MSVGRSRRQVALVLLLAAVLVSSGIGTAPAHAGTGLRAQMAPLINDDRADKDRTALELDLELSRYAKRHSQDMADAGSLFHTSDLAAKLKGKHWSIGGENVGVRSGPPGPRRRVHGFDAAPPEHPEQGVRPLRGRRRRVRRELLGDRHLLRLAPPDLAVDKRRPGREGGRGASLLGPFQVGPAVDVDRGVLVDDDPADAVGLGLRTALEPPCRRSTRSPRPRPNGRGSPDPARPGTGSARSPVTRPAGRSRATRT